MENIKISEIIKATNGKLKNNSFYLDEKNDIIINRVITDSREDFLDGNTIFVAIKGENFDGHKFLKSALEKGAKFCISSDESYENEDNIITVKDSLQGLIDIAGLVRSKINAPFVGITGSVGKTTTKDMTSCFLGAKFDVLKTQGNFNNQIGMPKTIFSFNYSDNSKPTQNCGVIEMGTSAMGEIDQLTMAVKPDVAVITCIGVSHIENFKTRDNILKGKMEIVNGLSKTGALASGALVLNFDDEYLQKVIKGEYTQENMPNKILTYSVKSKNADVYAKDIIQNSLSCSFIICFKNQEYKATLPCSGIHNVSNALAAFCCGYVLDVDLNAGVKALKDYAPSGARQSTEEFNGGLIIKDYYNASPDSMVASLNVLADLKNYKIKIAVLADMLELGDIAEKSHIQVGQTAENLKIDYLLSYGDLSKNYLKSLNNTVGEYFQDKNSLIKRLKELYNENCAVLIKGSRGMKLEDVYHGLTEKE